MQKMVCKQRDINGKRWLQMQRELWDKHNIDSLEIDGNTIYIMMYYGSIYITCDKNFEVKSCKLKHADSLDDLKYKTELACNINLYEVKKIVDYMYENGLEKYRYDHNYDFGEFYDKGGKY